MAILYKDIEIFIARIRYNVRFTSKIYGCKDVNDIELHTKNPRNNEVKMNR